MTHTVVPDPVDIKRKLLSVSSIESSAKFPATIIIIVHSFLADFIRKDVFEKD